MIKKLALLTIALTAIAGQAQSATVREIIRSCGDDGKKYCKGVRYGEPMQKCLTSNKKSLTPVCKAMVDRLNKGEKVTLF